MKWSSNEIRILKQKYPNTLAKVLSKKIKRSPHSIHLKASQLKIKSNLSGTGTKKYTVNENFFSKPNLLNSYWAGFIAADGCIVENSEKSSTLSLFLAIRDLNLLKKLKKDMTSSAKIFNKNTLCSNGKRYLQCCFRINNKKITDDLRRNFNITPRKSLTLKPPKGLTKKQALAFIVGYIDGDGWITIQDNKPALGMIGTKSLLVWAHNKLKGPFLYKKSPIKKTKSSKIYTYRLYSVKAKHAFHILDTNYKSTLTRKWSKI